MLLRLEETSAVYECSSQVYRMDTFPGGHFWPRVCEGWLVRVVAKGQRRKSKLNLIYSDFMELFCTKKSGSRFQLFRMPTVLPVNRSSKRSAMKQQK